MSRKASKLRELFDAALERSAAERAAWMDEACSGDAELRADLAALLEAHESSGTWLDSPASLGPGVGPLVGPYTLVAELGHGGMGTVYLAERTIGRVRQKVALKIVRPGLATNTEVIRRFQQEREILASLEHPNIARLLDIGSTEDGVPYLVMDYVPGQTIDEWCAERGGDIREALRVFCVACDALQYAHDHGVIHRDLKPGNILITPDGMLKLLDFGVARLLRLDGETRTLATFTGPAPMTIEYASPEQIRGASAGPQSDVYSLGVVLFELLTGRRPFESHGRLIHEVAAAICGEPPVTPSLAAPSEDIRRQVAGDLDAIILKALRKEPDWRYASPGDLSADIRRHMAGDRVLARADTARYRLERFARRLLYPSEGVFQRPQGSLMWTAGVLGMLFMAERHQILTGVKARPSTTLGSMILAAWILWAIREGIRLTRAGRFSAIDRQAWTVFTVITIVAGTLTVVSSVRATIVPESMAIFWIAALAAGLLIVGLQASRLMIAGGVALLLSAILAAAFPQMVYVCLASGLFAGMVIPGLIFTFQPAAHHQANEEAPRQ